MDLIPLPVDARNSLDGQKNEELVKSTHEKAQMHIEKKNEQYATQVNKGRKCLIFLTQWMGLDSHAEGEVSRSEEI